jgi:hypothetical protein
MTNKTLSTFRRKLVQLLLVAICSVTSLAAQTVPMDKILVPLVVQNETPGLFGSRWITRLTILNQATTGALIFGYDQGCRVGVCPPLHTPPRITFAPRLQVFSSEVQGYFLYVDRDHVDSVTFTLLVKDLSRQDESWGTEIPVIRDDELFKSTINILDIPAEPSFRQTLRVYDFDAGADAQANIRLYETTPRTRPFDDTGNPATPDRLIFETTQVFRTATSGGGSVKYPGYIEVNLDRLTALAGVNRIRVEIEPRSPALRFWAFVSITHNETQRVTVLTPE